MNVSFIHLKAHTEYSIRDGLLQIKPWLEKVAAYRMPAVAITDHCNLFALIKFYRQAIALGIKPIIGADVGLKIDNDVYTVTLLCENELGYKNLTRLLSKAYMEGQTATDEAQITWEWLSELKSGLIALSGGRAGDVGHALLTGQKELAVQRLQRWLNQFGQNFYLELQRTGRNQEEEYIQHSVALAQDHHVPLVATNDVRFLEAADFEAHEARVCVHLGHLLDDPKRPRPYHEQQYLRSQQEMIELFADLPEALQNSVAIAKRCNVQLKLGEPSLPDFAIPAEGAETLEDYFCLEAKQGLAQRQTSGAINVPIITAYEQRLERELGVINRMGFAGYFLIVADFIRWAKSQSIPVGPGRGSGAGSLVAYVLGITEIDPLRHELLFERFLNPQRISMPDFDIDFCMERRDQVIDYVVARYGREAVSQIITFGTMAARAVVRDVGRVLGMSYGFVDKIAKLIPFELGVTLQKALDQEPQLADRYRSEEDVATLINLGRKLEGLARNVGKHAGGVVIAPGRLTDFVPVYCEQGSTQLVTQFDKDDVEAAGLVKFDFLGLRTLTLIDWTVASINKKRREVGEELLDLAHIPFDDTKTFDLLHRCETAAVFQLESRGMRDLIRRLHPDVFEEVVALVALFRPGPLQSGMVDDFINRKHGREAVEYPHPELEPILRATYGVILYQEQVMQIAQVLAGYSLGDADILRSAMGKKKPKEMAKQRKTFVVGAVGRGIAEKLAESIFDLMEKFAGYGFNRSHSVAYALIAYHTAWLKAHYPAEFMAAVLSSDMDNTDKVVSLLAECRHMQLKVNLPQINVGHYQFAVNVDGEIEYGLGAIKRVGKAAILHIVAEREQNGPFTSLFDFCQRLNHHKINRRTLEALIYAGAMDVFQESRAVLFANIDKALASAAQKQRDATMGQFDLFADMATPETLNYEAATPWSDKKVLQAEKEVLGLYLSHHPLQAYEEELDAVGTIPINQLDPIKMGGKENVMIGGVLTGMRLITTRRGNRMAIVTFEDRTGRLEATLFSKVFDPIRQSLEIDKIYVVAGRVENDDFSGGIRMVVESVTELDTILAKRAKQIVIHVSDQQKAEALLEKLPSVIESVRGGSCTIVLRYQVASAAADIQLGDYWRVCLSTSLLEQLQNMCGANNVKVGY